MRKNMSIVSICLSLILSVFAAGCGGGGGGGGGGSSTPTGDGAPLASAGPDQTVLTNSTVTLNGSQSTDEDGNLLKYSWYFISKPPNSQAIFSDSTAAKPTFVPDFDGVYTIALVVSAGASESLKDVVVITATSANVPPVADAGEDRKVTTGDTITLDGTGSFDADLDPLTFYWSFISTPAASTATVSDHEAAKPIFIADVDGDFVLSLVVHDGSAESVADIVTITATTGNSPPVAEAGADRSVTVGSTVALDGTGSSDADMDPITFYWFFSSKPAASAATLSDAAAPQPTFVADVTGDYVLRLIVNDGSVNSAVSTLTVTAIIANASPVAYAGPDQNVTMGSLVSLDGTGASDPDLDPITYDWSLTIRPITSVATLSNATSPIPTFTADAVGEYVLKLVVNDGHSDSSADTVTITVFSQNVKWVVDSGSVIDYSPTLGRGDQVYITAAYHVSSFNSDGSTKWDRYTWSNPVKNRPRSRVAVGDVGYVYVGYEDGTITSINKKWGTPFWKFKTNGSSYSEIEVSDQGSLYFGSDDGNLYVLDRDGRLMWSFQTDSVVGSPAIAADGHVYFGCSDSNLYALDSAGKLKWSVPFEGGEIGKPAIGDDGTIYVTGFYENFDKKDLVALNPDGTLKWIFAAANWMDGIPAIGIDGTIYITSVNTSSGGLYAVNPDGSRKWVFPTNSERHGSAVISEGSILLASEQALYSISSAGVENWKSQDYLGTIIGSPVIGADGTIYFGTSSKQLYALYGDI